MYLNVLTNEHTAGSSVSDTMSEYNHMLQMAGQAALYAMNKYFLFRYCVNLLLMYTFGHVNFCESYQLRH